MGKRVNRTLRRIGAALRQRMHHNPYEVAKWLGSVLNGWLRYYAVPTSLPSLKRFEFPLRKMWLRVLRRRSHLDRTKLDKLGRVAAAFWPRLTIRTHGPTIGCRHTPEVGAGWFSDHVRICAGVRSNAHPYGDSGGAPARTPRGRARRGSMARHYIRPRLLPADAEPTAGPLFPCPRRLRRSRHYRAAGVLARRAVGGLADAGRPPAPRDGRHVPGHHGAEWPRGTRRQGPRLADRARSAGTVFKTIRVRSNCALVCRRYRPASGTSSFTMRTDVAASDPPSDSARSSRRRPIPRCPWATSPVAVSESQFIRGRCTGSAGIRCRTRDGARGTRTQECFKIHMCQ